MEVVSQTSRSRASSSSGGVDALYLLTSPEGNLIEDDLNILILSNIRQCLISPLIDSASKRKVFENAIDAGYKKILNQVFDDIRKSGERVVLDSADLSGLDLSGLNLSGASAARCNLSGTRLKRSNLAGVNLVGADLSAARAKRTNFEGAMFDHTLANRLVTDNPRLAQSFVRVTDSVSSRLEITNTCLHGTGDAIQSGRKIFILPARLVTELCCQCVIL